MPDDQKSEDQVRQEEEEQHRRHTDEETDEEIEGDPSEPRQPDAVDDEGSGDDGHPAEAGTAYTPGDIAVPAIELEAYEQVEAVDIEETEPKVASEDERAVRVPELELQEAESATTTVDVATEPSDVAVKESDQEVPLVRLDAAPEVRVQVSSFDTAIRPPERRRRRQVAVPLFRKMSKPQVRAVMEFDDSVRSEVRQQIEQQEPVDEPVEVPIEDEGTGEDGTGVTAGEEGVRGEGRGVDVAELPDPFELMFSGGGELDSDRPLVIGINDRDGTHIGVLRTLCKRIYREKEGGEPDPLIIRDLEELTGGRRGKGEIRWLEAEDRIFSVQLDADEWEELTGELEADWNRIWNRIDQLFSQRFGVVIFNNILRRLPVEQEHLVQVIDLEPRRLSPDVQRDIARLCWGYVDVGEAPNFNMVFDYARELSERRLKEAGHVEGGIFRDATDPHDGPESDLHLRIKWFIVRYLVDDLRDQGLALDTPMQIEERIGTETPVSTGSSSDTAVADVKRGADVFEVETLFAEDREGSDPRNKLRESFIKYEGSNIDTVHVVLDNLTFHRHLQEIVQLKRNHQDWEDRHGLEIRFETLDLQGNELIDIDEAITRLQQIDERIGRSA